MRAKDYGIVKLRHATKKSNYFTFMLFCLKKIMFTINVFKTFLCMLQKNAQL